MGRPPTRQKGLRDGFYIEVHIKGANSGIKLRNDTKEEMLKAAEDYRKSKEVVVLGEHRDGEWVDENTNAPKKKKRKA